MGTTSTVDDSGEGSIDELHLLYQPTIPLYSTQRSSTYLPHMLHVRLNKWAVVFFWTIDSVCSLALLSENIDSLHLCAFTTQGCEKSGTNCKRDEPQTMTAKEKNFFQHKRMIPTHSLTHSLTGASSPRLCF